MQQPLVTNAANEKQIKAAKRKQKWMRDQELKDLRWLLSHKEGRRFYWRYLGICGVFRCSMTGNNSTFFKEGERNIGLQLFNDLNQAAPEAFVLMQKEQREFLESLYQQQKSEPTHEVEPVEENENV